MNENHAARALIAAAALITEAEPMPDQIGIVVEVSQANRADILERDYELSVHVAASAPHTDELARSIVEYAGRLQPDVTALSMRLISDFYSLRAVVVAPDGTRGLVKLFLTPAQALEFERIGVDMSDADDDGQVPPSSFLANLTALVEGATS